MGPSLASRRLWRAGFTAFSAAITILTVAGWDSASAQGWDPFSQLDTNRWERRSKPPEQSQDAGEGAGATDPSRLPPENAQGGSYPAGDDQRQPYLGPPDRRPRFGGSSDTYYPPTRGAAPTTAPSSGGSGPKSSAPSAVSSEELAPLPGAPPPAVEPAGGGASWSARTDPPPYPGTLPPASSNYSKGADRFQDPAAPMSGPARHDLAGHQQPPPLGNASDGRARELWRGLDAPTFEGLLSTLSIPPRSPALHHLWRSLLTADPGTSGGVNAGAQLDAVRFEALYRSGLIADIREALAASARPAADIPLGSMLLARSEIGAGRREAGCEAVRRVGNIRGEIPKAMRGEAILVSGYCAAATGNKPAAGLLAELAREEGIKPSPGLAALDAVALGSSTGIALSKDQKLSLIDYRILELAGATPAADELVKVATPALLSAVADDNAAAAELRLAAGEAAARLNAYDPKAMASLYRSVAGKQPSPRAQNNASAGEADTPQRRASLFAAAEAERTPAKKVRLIRTFLDSARRAGNYLPALVMVAPLTHDVGLVHEIGWFAETAIEANLAAANYERARMWTKFAASLDTGRNRSMDHWMALIDIADPQFADNRENSLAALEHLALMGRFSSDNLHRLATVLDALEYNVPIPLWEAASRTPQPTTGHLPETGVLTQLQDAAKKSEPGRMILLAMQTIGPDSADGAHMIALGDAIRALKRSGLEADARRLGFEALLPGWPRTLTN